MTGLGSRRSSVDYTLSKADLSKAQTVCRKKRRSTGSVELCWYLYHAGARPNSTNTLSNAIEKGNKDLVRYLLAIGFSERPYRLQSRYSLAPAIASKDLELLQLGFHSSNTIRNTEAVAKAIEEAARVGMNEVIP